MKKIAWLDTIRVFAALTVIVEHYINFFVHAGFDKMQMFFGHSGAIGVFTFFALSGYLIPASLERTPNLWSFYKKKLVRIVVPFTVAYVVMASAMVALLPLTPVPANRSPFHYAMYVTGFQWEMFLPILPVDVNFLKLFDLPMFWFIGEWFMGVLLILYIISPLLNMLVKRAPLLTFAASVVIAIATYYAALPLEAQGRILTAWWLFPTRIPEFVFGMILFTYKDFFEQHKQKIFRAVLAWTIPAVIVEEFMYFQESPEFLTCLFPLQPRSMLVSIPFIYLFFLFTDWLNKKFPHPLEWFNSYSDVSYMVILNQHVILFLFSDVVTFTELHTFGLFFMFFLIVVVIFRVSNEVKKFSDPVESWLLKRK